MGWNLQTVYLGGSDGHWYEKPEMAREIVDKKYNNYFPYLLHIDHFKNNVLVQIDI